MADIIAKLKSTFQKYYNSSNPKGIYIAAGGIFLILLAGVAFIILNRRDTPTFTADQQDEILAAVVANNPQAVLEGTESSDSVSEVPSPDLSGNGPIDELSPEDIQAPNLNVYNYRHTTTRITAGPMKNACTDQPTIENTQEYYEYFDPQHSFYTSISKDSDDEIVNVNIAKYGTDINENYYYAGGTLSAKAVFKPYASFDNSYNLYPASYPNYSVSYPVSYLNTSTRVAIQGYFGKDPRVTAVTYIGGRKHYEITGTYSYSCNAYTYNPDQLHTMTAVYTVDASTFAVVEVKHYKGTVASSNLIYTNKTDVERAKVEYSQVEANFNYTNTDNVITLDYRNYVYSPSATLAGVLNHIQTNSLTVLVPTASYKLLSFYGENFPERITGERYREQRDYYPANAKGEARYQQMLEGKKQSPSTNTYVEVEGNFISTSLYSDNTVEKLKPTFTRHYDPKTVTEKQSILSLEGTNVNVTLIGVPYGSTVVPVSYPASYLTNPGAFPASYPYVAPIFYHIALFADGAKVFSVQGRSLHDKVIVTSHPYKLLNTGENADYQELAPKITQLYAQ
jgi:hypothetical protein